MHFKKWVSIFFLMLASCATTRPSVPVVQTVYCLTPEQYSELVRAEPEKIGHQLKPDLPGQNKQLVGQNVLMRSYADGLLLVLGSCIGTAPEPSAPQGRVQPSRYRTSTSETQQQQERIDRLRDNGKDDY